MIRAPLRGIQLFLLVMGLGLVCFLDGLDFSIANVALPTIASSYGVTSQEGTWVITLFAVSNTISMAISGWLGVRFGSVKVVLISLVGIIIVSFCCGMAWSFNSLIIFRVLQGCFAGPLMSLPQSLVLANCPPERKQIASGFVIMLLVLGPVLGPYLGGWLTENYGWPWIFYINIPLGIIGLILTYAILHDREHATIKQPIDVMGFVFLAIGLTALQVFLDRGNDLDWFGSTEVIVLALVAGTSIAFFIVWNLYSENPLVEFSFFKDKNFTLGTLLSALPYLVIGGTTIIIPLWVQMMKGYTPYWAGVVVMPIGILPIVLAPLLGLVMARISLRALISFGYIVFAITCFWLSGSVADITLAQLMLPRLIQGVGIAFCFLPLFQIALSNIQEVDLPKATALHNLIRVILGGGGISTAVYVTMWQRREAMHHSNLTEVLHPLRETTLEAYKALSTVGITGKRSAGVFDLIVTNQAYAIAFNDLLWISGWAFVIFIPFVWLCREPKKGRIISPD